MHILKEPYLQKELALTSSHKAKLLFVGINPIEYLKINQFHVF